MPEDALEEHDQRVAELVKKWKIPRREAQLLLENQQYE